MAHSRGDTYVSLCGRRCRGACGNDRLRACGRPHTYFEAHGPTRHLIIMTPRLYALVAALHAAPFDQHPSVMRRYDSEIMS
ncbi:MAG: hypothetical protein R2854_29980 [Caldilineaceae bacterium]